MRAWEDDALVLRLALGVRAPSGGALWARLEVARTLGIRVRCPAATAESLALLQGRAGYLVARAREHHLAGHVCGLVASCLLADFWEVP